MLLLSCHCTYISWVYRAVLQLPPFTVASASDVAGKSHLCCRWCYLLGPLKEFINYHLISSFPVSLVYVYISHHVCLCAPAPLTRPHFVGGWEVYTEDFFIPSLIHYNTEWIKPWYVFSSSLARGKEKKPNLQMAELVWDAQFSRVALIGLFMFIMFILIGWCFYIFVCVCV